MRRRRAVALFGLLSLAIVRLAAHAGSLEPRIELAVDLRDAPERIFHARESIAVVPGPLALRYAKWIPGEHSPSGPIGDLAGLRFRAAGKTLAWERDPVDPWRILIEIPASASNLEIELDFLVPSEVGAFTVSPAASARLAVLSWNTVILFPDGQAASGIVIEPSLALPPGWQAATALRTAPSGRTAGAWLDRGDRRRGRPPAGLIRYAPVSLETLIDSPVAAGANVRAIPLDAPTGSPEHVLHLVADGPAALDAKPALLDPLVRHLVPEALALFGAWHYERYDFLLTLSDHLGHFGLEHHASSDNRLPERTLVDASKWLMGAGLLPHEFTHSWNAKYRRPEGLATRDYQTPMVGDLLWVYEGLTSYLGDVLTARAGLVTEVQARENLALQAAGLAHTKGRGWRPLGDTTRDAQHAYGARAEGSSWRRGVDFYDEGVMLWLEVDATIRTRTGGARSLDDFCLEFFGPPNTGATLSSFTRAQLVAALTAIAPGDWEGFFRERVDRLRADPPVEGLEAAGWRLDYDDAPNAMLEAYATSDEASLDLRYSIGAVVGQDGRIHDVVPGGPVADAGIGVGAVLVAIDSRAFTPEVLADALEAAHRTKQKRPIELLVRNSDYYSTHPIFYTGGVRFPHLVRDAHREDLLSKILAPRTWTRPPAEPGVAAQSR